MKPLIHARKRSPLFVIALSLASLGFLPRGQAVVPPPDGGYPNFTTAEGTNALRNLTTGAANTGVGWYSLFTNSTASFNTAVGAGTLLFNNADSNTAVGTAALLLNSTGFGNTAVGTSALLNNTEGYSNTAMGDSALEGNIAGVNNTANGVAALAFNTAGSDNTAVGRRALLSNSEGSGNTASGVNALEHNRTGANNTATGVAALSDNETGNSNTAYGYFALSGNLTGGNNVAVGNSALDNNTAGVFNIAVGYQTGTACTAGDNNIYIGNEGAEEWDTIRIGATQSRAYMAGVYGGTVNNQGAAVLIDTSGKLGTTIGSSRRFKEDIKPMDTASEAILAFNPVSFRYKGDNTNTPQFGLIAEQVADVIPDLVVRDKEGKPYSVRYDQVNAMLLNEFLKEHRKNEKQEATIAGLKREVASLAAAVKEQAAQIQRVNAKIEMTERASQTVAER